MDTLENRIRSNVLSTLTTEINLSSLGDYRNSTSDIHHLQWPKRGQNLEAISDIRFTSAT